MYQIIICKLRKKTLETVHLTHRVTYIGTVEKLLHAEIQKTHLHLFSGQNVYSSFTNALHEMFPFQSEHITKEKKTINSLPSPV